MSFKFTRNKYTKFFDQSRKQKKLSFIKLKNKIRRFPDRLFFSHHFVDERDDGFLEEYRTHQWIDVYFLSRKYPNVFYSATFITGCMQLWDALETEGFEYTNKTLTEEQLAKSNDRSFVPDEICKGCTRMVHNYPEMRDLYHNTWQGRIAELALSKDVHVVIPDNEKKMNHTYGIRLHVTLPLETFTGKDITEWIEKFYANGEEFFNNDPIEVRTDTLKRLKYLREEDCDLIKYVKKE